MKIGIIQASSQIDKNELLYKHAKKYALNDDVYNFGCFEGEEYSYIEISLLIGLLINSKAIDFIVTGCSSGQGMMLACNSVPNVLCGYIPTGQDAYLFTQINNGNVVSLPLGEEYTYQGENNLENTIKKLFSEPFGQGYPKKDAKRKLEDSNLLKQIRLKSQIDIIDMLDSLDNELIQKILNKKDVVSFILNNGNNKKLISWIVSKINKTSS